MDIISRLRKRLGIRSPSLEAQGYYFCEKCSHHDDCICVVCEDGRTVVCNLKMAHVSRWGSCKNFKRIKD